MLGDTVDVFSSCGCMQPGRCKRNVIRLSGSYVQRAYELCVRPLHIRHLGQTFEKSPCLKREVGAAAKQL